MIEIVEYLNEFVHQNQPEEKSTSFNPIEVGRTFFSETNARGRNRKEQKKRKLLSNPLDEHVIWLAMSASFNFWDFLPRSVSDASLQRLWLDVNIHRSGNMEIARFFQAIKVLG